MRAFELYFGHVICLAVDVLGGPVGGFQGVFDGPLLRVVESDLVFGDTVCVPPAGYLLG